MSAPATILYNEFESYTFKIIVTFSGTNELAGRRFKGNVPRLSIRVPMDRDG